MPKLPVLSNENSRMQPDVLLGKGIERRINCPVTQLNTEAEIRVIHNEHNWMEHLSLREKEREKYLLSLYLHFFPSEK